VRELNEAERRCVLPMRYTPWGDVPGGRRVFGGIEIALWDARARTEGVPLHVLLGGAVRNAIGLTEYFGYRLPGAGEPGESTPLEVARYCARMIEEHGADGFEGKVATVGLDEEVELVREVRAAIGPSRELRLDANGGWTVPTAREALRRLEPFGIRYYEDPVETPDELAQLRSATTASFSTHVIDLERAVRLRVPDTIVTNLNELGGIRRTVELIAACARFDVGFRFHSGETGVGSAAYLHVSAAVEHVREPSQTLFRWYADDVIAGGPFVPQGGVVPVPSGPGLGVELDRAALRRLHERYRSEGPFPAGPADAGYGGTFRRR
jgi:glucarate dehydratase